MADKELADLTAATTVDGTELVYIVVNPSGSQLDRKITVANLLAGLTASQILTLIKTVDGSGSGLDADLLDGQSSAYYAVDADVVHDTGAETIAGVKTFSSDPLIPDEAYDATAWNGVLEPPTKNAVRDKIEDILDGVTFTGDVVVPDEAYDATAWNGSLEVPTKNAVRDQVESLSGTYVDKATDGDIKRVSNGGTEYSLRWQSTGPGASGIRGAVIARSAAAFPIGIVLESVAGTPSWDTCALDATTDDLVLAYSYTASADQIRVRNGGTNGPHISIGPSVGRPATTKRLHIFGSATETTATSLVYGEIANGSSVLDYFRGQFNGAENCNISRDGKASFGSVYGGYLSFGSLEAKGGIAIQRGSADPVLQLARHTDLSQAWNMGVDSSGVFYMAQHNGNSNKYLSVSTSGGIYMGPGTALATSATDGFYNVPSMAGTPTGSPTTFGTRIPCVIDTTGSKLWARIGGTWKSVTFA